MYCFEQSLFEQFILCFQILIMIKTLIKIHYNFAFYQNKIISLDRIRKRKLNFQDLNKEALINKNQQKQQGEQKSKHRFINTKLMRQKQITSQILKCIKQSEVYSIYKRNRRLNSIHLCIIFSKLIELHKIKTIKQKSCLTQNFLDVVKNIQQNIEEMNPQSLIMILTSINKMQKNDYLKFMSIQAKVIKLFIQQNSLEVISYELALRLVYVLGNLSKYHTNNHNQGIKLIKLCLNKIQTYHRDLKTKQLLNLNDIVYKFSLQKTNFLKIIGEQLLKRNKYLRFENLSKMLENFLRNKLIFQDFCQNNNEYNLIVRTLKQIHKKQIHQAFYLSSLISFYQILKQLTDQELNNISKQKTRVYYSELIIDHSLIKYKNALKQLEYEQNPRIFNQFSKMKAVFDIGLNTRSKFIDQTMKRFIKQTLDYENLLPLKLKIIILKYIYLKNLEFQNLSKFKQNLFQAADLKLDKDFGSVIFELFEIPNFFTSYQNNDKFQKLLIKSIKYFFSLNYDHSKNSLAKNYYLLAKLSSYSEASFSLIIKAFQKSLQFICGLSVISVDKLNQNKSILKEYQSNIISYEFFQSRFTEDYDIKLYLIKKISSSINMLYGFILFLENFEILTKIKNIQIMNKVKENFLKYFVNICYPAMITIENLEKLEMIITYFGGQQHFKLNLPKLNIYKNKKILEWPQKNRSLRQKLVQNLKLKDEKVQYGIIRNSIYFDVLVNNKIGYIIVQHFQQPSTYLKFQELLLRNTNIEIKYILRARI